MDMPPAPAVEVYTNVDGETAYRLTAKGRAHRKSMAMAGDARGDEVRPEHRTRHGRTLLGGLITYVSGFILGLMALVAAGLGMILWSVAENAGPDTTGFPACRTQACADESTLVAAAFSGFVVFVIVALVLASRSTDRALMLVAIASFIVGGILLFVLAMGTGDYETLALLLPIPAAPLLLGIGSVLRLSGRRGPLVTGD
jgi:hypothetical protein